MKTSLLWVFCSLWLTLSTAFSPKTYVSSHVTFSRTTARSGDFPALPLPCTSTSVWTRYQQSTGSRLYAKNNMSMDGSGRGLILMGIVLLINVWIFSIPPEFRRQHICSSTFCEAHRDAATCYSCVTLGEWTDEVKEYYRNGGGVQFDFSIAEETKAQWSLPGMK